MSDTTSRPLLEVEPRRALIDVTRSIRLSGVSPGSRVVIEASAVGFSGTGHSAAEFVADQMGVVDVGSSPSLGGTYVGIDAMGLFWSLTTSSRVGSGTAELDSVAMRFTASAEGVTVAEASCEVLLVADGVEIGEVTEGRLRGRFFQPDGPGPFPAVLVLGGSGGGIPIHQAACLASHGFAVLALAYFRYADLPAGLERIPLEYFEEGVSWLRRQSGVQAGGVGVIGTSRGGELALLLGSTFPTIRAIVGIVPSHVVWGSIGGSSPYGVAWLHRGEPIAPMHRLPSRLPSPLVSAALAGAQFAPAAWGTLIFAEDEASRLGLAVISPELLLLGILREQTGAGFQIVRELCGDVDLLAAAIHALLPASNGSSDGPLLIGPDSTRAIKQAMALLKGQPHLLVGQVHLLLAILEQDGPLVQALNAMGVTASGVATLWQRAPAGPQPAGHPTTSTPDFLRQLANSEAEARATIPVERINGPVLLISGEADAMWPSALMSRRAMERLAREGHRFADEHLCYADAGHTVGSLPNTPTTVLDAIHPVDGARYAFGGTPQGVARGNADAWPKMIAFLQSSLAGPPAPVRF